MILKTNFELAMMMLDLILMMWSLKKNLEDLQVQRYKAAMSILFSDEHLFNVFWQIDFTDKGIDTYVNDEHISNT